MVTYAWKQVVAYAVPGDWAPAGLLQLMTTEYKFAVSFAILIIVLLFKPTGLFKGQSV
jgi:branched-chain amino acid transport system permease protein